MKAFFAAIGGLFGTLGLGCLVMALGYALSWIVTCGLIYLVTLIFGWSFSWLTATGIWLILCIFRFVVVRCRS